MDKTKMGTFIREQRMALGLTQQQLADQLHVTNKAVSRWETGNAYPDIALLDDLAAALSVSVEELCRGERIALPSADTFPVRNSDPSVCHRSTAVTLQTPPTAGGDHRLYPAAGSVRPLADLWRTLSLVPVILAFPSFCIIFPSADDGRISIKRILFLITFQTVYSKFLS